MGSTRGIDIGAMIFASWTLALTLVSFCLMWVDKRRAQSNGEAEQLLHKGGDAQEPTRAPRYWRIPEKRLHLFELLGGWLGAVLGMVLCAHKRRKPSFYLVTALISVLHLAAWGYLLYKLLS